MKDKWDISKKFYKLCVRDRIMLIMAVIFTIGVIIAIPAVAWFTNKKQMATMAKIDSPAKLSLLSGAGEDIIRFKMADIDVTQGNEKYFVFCVEGEDISRYDLQLAHTTNINFHYDIYQAKATASSNGVEYVKENGDIVRYQPAASPLPGGYVNGTADEATSRIIGNANYDEPSYDVNDKRHKFAEPLYWQTSDPINADNTEYDENTESRSFRNYYVLKVSWTAGEVDNDKETDMIYITAQVS